MHLTPMLQVDDVAGSSAWYQRVLGLVSGHGGDQFEMLFAGAPYATPLVLQLHRWDHEEHGHDGVFGTPGAPRGNGCSLWLEVADRAALDALVLRAREVGAVVLQETHWNPLAHHDEVVLQDPDRYVLVACTPFDPTR